MSRPLDARVPAAPTGTYAPRVHVGTVVSVPKVVHCKKAPKGTFCYVGRPTVFGNPFNLEDPSDEAARVAVVESYREYFLRRVASDDVFRRAVLALKGRDLGCWCAPRLCHASVILEWLSAQ